MCSPRSYEKVSDIEYCRDLGTWQEQRSILRQNVTAIKFVGDGDAMIGGTSDGVLWVIQLVLVCVSSSIVDGTAKYQMESYVLTPSWGPECLYTISAKKFAYNLRYQ